MADQERADESRRTEEALRRSEARFAAILAIAADAIISIDASGRITLFNECAERTFGHKSDEVIGKPLDILIPPEFRAGHGRHIADFSGSREAARRMGERQEIFGLKKDGSVFPAEASISKLDLDGERIYTVVLRDITDRRTSEAALRESERRLWAFLDNSSVIGWMKDEEGRYVFLSGNFQHWFGRESGSWLGKTDLDVRPRRVAEEIRASDRLVLKENREIEVLEEADSEVGGRSWWLTHKFPFQDAKGRLFVGGLGVNITHRIKAEAALAESHRELEARIEERTRELRAEMTRHEESQTALARLQRMEALGQLTGGVAHDFNNLLTVISGNLQLIGMDLQDSRLTKYLDEAERAAEMGARLNQRLMTFAKQRRLAPVPVNLNDQVIGVRELLRRSLGENILLSTDLADELWTVRADPSEIENALVNLAINARDAMPEGGKLMVATRNAEIGPGEARVEAGLTPGRYVQLTVSDTGCGMTPEVKTHAFEPFFTTKGHGKGTGLGLATIYGFVTQSGGHVVLDSEPGRGTAISIYLPMLEVEAGDACPDGGEVPLCPARGETILVVEDNPAVRRVTVERLTRMGYATREAADGDAAIHLIERLMAEGAPLDLVFSDVVMPGTVSGFDLARQSAARWPSLKVVLTSGYAPGESEGATSGAQSLEILRKPYSQTALEQAIRRALEGRT